MALDLTTLVGGGAVVGVLIAAWDYVKVYLSKIYSLFFVRISTKDKVQHALTVWLTYNCKRARITTRVFGSFTNFVKPLNKNQLIVFEDLSPDPTVYWKGKIPFVVSGGGQSITFLRWTMNTEKFLEEVIDCYNEKLGDNLSYDRDRFYIRKFNGNLQNFKKSKGSDGLAFASKTEAGSPTPDKPPDSQSEELFLHLPLIKWKKGDIGQIKRPDPLAYLALSEDCSRAIEDLRLWRKSENWYKDRFIPWKKGVLLFGRPGNGKSSFAKALAMELNIPIMIFNLTDMSNTDFQESWDRVKNNTPCMVLLEDIDAVFDGRKNIAHEDGGLSFDCLLNSMDGVEASDGILIVATTNHLEKIDEALGKPNGDNISTRPGRIDRAIELGPPTADGRKKIAKRILIDFPEEIDKIVEEGHHDTGAQFQERCSRLALKLFWKNKGS